MTKRELLLLHLLNQALNVDSVILITHEWKQTMEEKIQFVQFADSLTRASLRFFRDKHRIIEVDYHD